MNNAREEQLARGLEQLQNDVRHITNHLESLYSLIPVIQFDDMYDAADNSDISFIEAQTERPPDSITYPTNAVAQLPLFDIEPPVTIIFENVTINGEVVDMSEREE